MEKSTEDKIAKLQMIEQGMQNFLIQKQQLHAQLAEIESALRELENSEESYKIVGNIMIKSKKEDLIKDLNSKKEMNDLKVKTLEKQENQMKEKASKMQAEVMEQLNKK